MTKAERNQRYYEDHRDDPEFIARRARNAERLRLNPKSRVKPRAARQLRNIEDRRIPRRKPVSTPTAMPGLTLKVMDQGPNWEPRVTCDMCHDNIRTKHFLQAEIKVGYKSACHLNLCLVEFCLIQLVREAELMQIRG